MKRTDVAAVHMGDEVTKRPTPTDGNPCVNENETCASAENEPQDTHLFTPAFAALLAAQLFSLTGSAVARFVLPLYLLNLTGSASLYGAAAAAAFVPYILCMPVGGVAADRVRKQRYMAALDAALALVAMGYLALAGTAVIVVVTFAALMLLFACHALYQPAIQASVPHLVARERVTQAVALVTQVNMLTGILGPVLGGAVFGFFGIKPIMALSTVAFVVSSVLILALVKVGDMREGGAAQAAGAAAAHAAGAAAAHTGGIATAVGVCDAPRTARAAATAPTPGRTHINPFAVFIADLQVAARFLRSHPLLWHAIAFAAACNLVLSAGLTVGGAYIVTEWLGLSNQLMGIAEASYGVGGLLGGLLVAARPAAFPFEGVPRTLLLASLGLAPIAGSLALGLPSIATFVIMLISLAWILGCATCFTIALTGALQTSTPPNLIGKVMALMYAAVNCATPLGQVIFGIAFDAATPAAIVTAMLVAMLIFSILMYIDFRRKETEW